MENFTSFQSSNTARISYDKDRSTLEVEFHNGSIYQYYDVPEHIWEQMKQADSMGRFIHENLKGHYRYARV